jgi:hypothetical protein
VWADHFTVDVGTVRVGVRADRHDVGEALRRALGSLVVDDSASTPNYSFRFGASSRDFHVLYWGGCMQSRSPDVRRVLRALLLHLAAHANVPAGLLRVKAAAAVKDGQVTLAPPLAPNELAATVRRLQDRGVTVLDAPFADIDIDRGELVVADRFEYEPAALASLVDSMPRPRRPDTGLPSGRYPIERWLFFDRSGPGTRDIGRAAATVAAAAAVQGGEADGLLARLAALLHTVPSFGVHATTVVESVEVLAGAAASDSSR